MVAVATTVSFPFTTLCNSNTAPSSVILELVRSTFLIVAFTGVETTIYSVFVGVPLWVLAVSEVTLFFRGDSEDTDSDTFA